jgi:DNA-binding NarL/FixJ family response regulator
MLDTSPSTRRTRSSWGVLFAALNDVSRDETAWATEIGVAAREVFRGDATLACFLLAPSAAKARAVFDISREDRGVTLAVRPAPRRLTVLAASFDGRGSHERRVLARIGFYLEAAHRRRLHPEQIVGRFDEVATEEMWTAFMTGAFSIVPETIANDGIEYEVLANDDTVAAARALSKVEQSVVCLAVKGASGKEISFELGLTPSAISVALANAAAKVGAPSVAELLRIGAHLTVRLANSFPRLALTTAEQGVLELVRRGHGNAEIARVRERSLRTVANQIASILRKTGAQSRRALLVWAPVTR